MNLNHFFEASPYWNYFCQYPWVIQGSLGLGILFFIATKIKCKFYQTSYRGKEIFYFGKQFKISIKKNDPAGVIGIEKNGHKKNIQYVALPFDLSFKSEPLKATKFVTETITGTTSGTYTSNGTYIPSQTVTLTRNTGQTYQEKVGEIIVLSFYSLDGDKVVKQTISGEFYGNEYKKFLELWNKFMIIYKQNEDKMKSEIKANMKKQLKQINE